MSHLRKSFISNFSFENIFVCAIIKIFASMILSLKLIKHNTYVITVIQKIIIPGNNKYQIHILFFPFSKKVAEHVCSGYFFLRTSFDNLPIFFWTIF